MDDLRSFEKEMLTDIAARQWAAEVALQLRLLEANLRKHQQPMEVCVVNPGPQALIRISIDLALWRASVVGLRDALTPTGMAEAAAVLDAALQSGGIPAMAIFDDRSDPDPGIEDDGYTTIHPALADRSEIPAGAPVPAAEEAPEPVTAEAGDADTAKADAAVTDDPQDSITPEPVAPETPVEPAARVDLIPASDPMNDIDKALLIRLYNRGLTNAEIAARMGRDPRGFYHIVKRVIMQKDAEATSLAPAPAPEPAAVPLTSAERRISQRLNDLGHRAPWTTTLDLELVLGLTRGRKLAEVALDLGIDALACKLRFNGLCPDPTFEAQKQLLQVLTHRAAAAASKAA